MKFHISGRAEKWKLKFPDERKNENPNLSKSKFAVSKFRQIQSWEIPNEETHLLKNVEENDAWWWEVESEIRSLIEDILYKEVTKKTGILIEVNMLWIKEWK